MHRHHTWSGGTRARTASLYTYVHKGCGQRGTHRNPTAAQLLQERERERGGVPTTSPPSMKSSRAGKNPGTEEQEEQQETRTPLGCYSGDLLLMSAHNDQPQVGTEKRRKKKKNDNSARQPQERCCPATAPLLLLPGVFLVTPPRLFVVVTTGTARHTQHHPHSTSTRTHEGHASGDVLRAPRVATAQRALPPRLRRALGGLREQLLEQAFALVAAGLVINPGCGLLRRWGVRGRQQREEGRCRLRGPAP